MGRSVSPGLTLVDRVRDLRYPLVMPFNNLGFGQAGDTAAPLNQFVSGPHLAGPLDWLSSVTQSSPTQAGPAMSMSTPTGDDPWAASAAGSTTQQSMGVAQYGSIWASKNCPACDATIREMQALVNRCAGAFGLPVQIQVDGKVGAGTVSAFQSVARAAVSRGIPSGNLLVAYSTPELIAKNADKARNLLKAIADKAGGPIVATNPPTIPPATGVPSYPTSTQPVPSPAGQLPLPPLPTTSASTAFKGKLPYVIGGAVLLAGVAAAVLILRAPTSMGD